MTRTFKREVQGNCRSLDVNKVAWNGVSFHSKTSREKQRTQIFNLLMFRDYDYEFRHLFIYTVL